MEIDIPDITWSKPITLLVEKISNAIGVWYEPRQNVRMARADAKIARIRTESQIEIAALERRTRNRLLAEEMKKQRNIEGIMRLALPQLDEKADPTKVEDDWITNFFDKCKLISDVEMQELWSRILAGEANAPGTFSKRTVNFLASLDKSDTQLFTNLCTYGWQIGKIVVPLVFNLEDETYKRHGITTNSLEHLKDIGMIHFDNMNTRGIYYKSETGLPIKVTVFYYEKPTHIEVSGQSGYTLGAGYVGLTKVGQELAPICGSTPCDEFRDYVVTKWKEWGYIKEEMAEDRADLE
jgi:hypothetical protein